MLNAFDRRYGYPAAEDHLQNVIQLNGRTFSLRAAAASSACNGRRSSRVMLALCRWWAHGRRTRVSRPHGRVTWKAAFIYNFAKLSSWPADTFARGEDPLIIGVIGSDDVAAALVTQLKAKQVAGHPVEVRRLGLARSRCRGGGGGGGGAPCAVPRGGRGSLAAQHSDCLYPHRATTIGDGDAFVSRGGAIRFVAEASRLRFQINRAATEKSGVKLSCAAADAREAARRRTDAGHAG